MRILFSSIVRKECMPVTVRVNLSPKTFRRFAIYDTFVQKKRWRLPLFFALIMLAFAAACFFLTDKQGHLGIGWLLTVIGVGLPVLWFVMFLLSLRTSVKAQKLPRPVYTLIFSEEIIDIQSATRVEEHVRLPWDRVFRLVRDRNCVYLYATEQKAFLLPSGQADVPDNELWDYLVLKTNQKQVVCK